MIEINNKDFNKIITDLIKDIALVFPDILNNNTNEDIINIIKYIEYEIVAKKEYDIVSIDNDNESNIIDQSIIDNYNSSCNNLLLYCLQIYPKHFFEILYKNNTLFSISDNQDNEDNEDNQDNLDNQDNQDNQDNEDNQDNQDNEDNQDNKKIYNTYFLPNIDFKLLFNDKSISQKTIDILWNYLQLILITIVSNIESEHSFGDAAKLFEAIQGDELFSEFNKIINNFKNMHTSVDNNDISTDGIFNSFKNIFDISANMNNIPDISNIQGHLNEILNGKIGKLAAEFSEDLYKEFNIDEFENLNVQNIGDVYKVLFKDPKKLLNVIGKMGEKLDQKIKTGELSQREIIEESTKMFGSITNTDISGMDGMQVFKDMMEGFANSNKNFNKTAFNNMISKEKTRNRMREKLNKKTDNNKNTANNTVDNETMRSNLFDLLKDESKDLKDLNSTLSHLMDDLNNTSNNKPHKNKNKNKKKK